jgi:hypothetical protein
MSSANDARAVEVLLRAARIEHDFAGWLADVLAQVAGQLGSSDALIEGRPGSWEASLVDQLVKGTVGYDDEYLPEARTKLTDARPGEIRDIWADGYGGVAQRELAAEFGVSTSTIATSPAARPGGGWHDRARAPDAYRVLTTIAVLVVAAIAAVISFEHIEGLAVRYGQPILAAVLLPLSIDGTVAVASMTMLRAARLGVTAPWLARTMLLLSVAATVACNVAFGISHGLPGALLSGWPAVAFVGSAEVAISMSRPRTPRAPESRA